MAPTVQTGEPDQLRAGDTWTWIRPGGEFPASEGWTASYAITGIEAVTWSTGYAVAAGNDYTITIPASATATLDAGTYKWAVFFTLAGARYTGDSGVFEVLPNLATSTAPAEQTHAERMVVLIQAELERRLTGASTSGGQGGIEHYVIGDREITRIPALELKQMLAGYRAQAAQERHPNSFGTTVRVAFVRP